MAASSVLSSREMVKKWAQVSLVAHPNEQRDEVGRLAEALSSFIRAEAQRLVVGAKGPLSYARIPTMEPQIMGADNGTANGADNRDR